MAGFVSDVLERLEELQKRVMLGQQHHVRFEPIALHTTTDDRLVWSILDRLQTID